MENIVNFKGEKITVPNEPQDWVISVIGPKDDKDEVYYVSGYFKLGQQFVAVLDGEGDNANLVFAVPAHLVRSAVLEQVIEVNV